MIGKMAAAVIIAAATLGVTAVAPAQDNAPASAQKDVHSLIQQLRDKRTQLQQIYAAALEANAELRQRERQFIAMVDQAARNNGYDVDAARKRIQAMLDKLKTDGLGADERTALKQKLAAERRALGRARAKVLRQPAIRKASRQLQQATLAAMTEQNPDVKQLIASMKKLRRQLRAAVGQQAGN